VTGNVTAARSSEWAQHFSNASCFIFQVLFSDGNEKEGRGGQRKRVGYGRRRAGVVREVRRKRTDWRSECRGRGSNKGREGSQHDGLKPHNRVNTTTTMAAAEATRDNAK